MPDFDANDDPLRLSASDKDEPFERPRLAPRLAPRARQLADLQCRSGRDRARRRVRPELAARAKRVARVTCERRIVLLGSPPRRRRRLWTQCHGQPPGPAI